jgi:hypothetical protein
MKLGKNTNVEGFPFLKKRVAQKETLSDESNRSDLQARICQVDVLPSRFRRKEANGEKIFELIRLSCPDGRISHGRNT